MLREQRGAHEAKRPRTRTYEHEEEEGEDDADAASTSPTGGGGDVGGEQEESGGSAREGSANAANDEVSGVVQQGVRGPSLQGSLAGTTRLHCPPLSCPFS